MKILMASRIRPIWVNRNYNLKGLNVSKSLINEIKLKMNKTIIEEKDLNFNYALDKYKN